MADNNFSESMKELLQNFTSSLSTKTVIGDPVKAGDAILVPLMEVSVGMGVGAYKNAKETANTAGGLGAKISPFAILLIQGDKTQLINIKNQDAITKVLDMIPQVSAQIKDMIIKRDPEIQEKIDEIKNGTN